MSTDPGHYYTRFFFGWFPAHIPELCLASLRHVRGVPSGRNRVVTRFGCGWRGLGACPGAAGDADGGGGGSGAGEPARETGILEDRFSLWCFFGFPGGKGDRGLS